jgi:hypothetical protein
MSFPQMYIALAIVVLLVVALLVLWVRPDERQNNLTPLASFAFAFVLAGMLFGETRLLGYGLMGIGVLLAIADIFNRNKA